MTHGTALILGGVIVFLIVVVPPILRARFPEVWAACERDDREVFSERGADKPRDAEPHVVWSSERAQAKKAGAQ